MVAIVVMVVEVEPEGIRGGAFFGSLVELPSRVVAPAGQRAVGADRAGVSAAGRERAEGPARNFIQLPSRVIAPAGQRAVIANRAGMGAAGRNGEKRPARDLLQLPGRVIAPAGQRAVGADRAGVSAAGRERAEGPARTPSSCPAESSPQQASVPSSPDRAGMDCPPRQLVPPRAAAMPSKPKVRTAPQQQRRVQRDGLSGETRRDLVLGAARLHECWIRNLNWYSSPVLLRCPYLALLRRICSITPI